MNQSRHPYGNASTPPSTPLNAFTTPTRSTSDGFLPGISTNNKNNTNNTDSFSNRTTNPAPDTQSRSGLPFLSDIQNRSAQPPLRHIPTPTNNPTSLSGGSSNQSTQLPPPPPPPAQNNPSSSFGGFPPNPNPNLNQPPTNNPQSSFNGSPWNMNPNQPPAPAPPTNNPQSSFNDSPWNTNSNQPPPLNNSQYPPNDSSSGMNNNQQPMYKPSDFQSYQPGAASHRSRLELDYPIEDVLIDANIPQTMAVKINDVVEQDRLGNAYHIHRYTFQSSNPQQIAFKNNSHFGGSRYIREVNYPDSNTSYEYTKRAKPVSHRKHRTNKHFNRSYDHFIDELIRTPGSYVLQPQNSFDIQSILQQQQQQQQFAPFSSTINSTPWTIPNSATGPIFYYTAQALSHDPMRQF